MGVQEDTHNILLMETKNLLIIGARGWGREVLLAFQSYREDLDVKGFLDDNKHAFDGLRGEFPPIISSVEDYQIQPNDVFFCALGDPIYRKKYVDIIEAKGGRFISYISPKAAVSPNATIGEGSYIGSLTFVSDNVCIGKHAMIHGVSTFGHDVKIGDFVSVEAYSFFWRICQSWGFLYYTCSVNNPPSHKSRR